MISKIFKKVKKNKQETGEIQEIGTCRYSP